MESSILIHSNVSVTEVPVLSYDGKLRKIMPGENENDMGTMNGNTRHFHSSFFQSKVSYEVYCNISQLKHTLMFMSYDNV